MRIALINWTSRHVGGAETYVARVIAPLLQAGHELFFCYEADEPLDREPIANSQGLPASCLRGLGTEAALQVLVDWRPDVLYVHGVTDPELERRLLLVAPAVLLAHNYHGTCISGGKAFQTPSVRPCDRRFGPSCLALYYPRRCGGLSPVTMGREYRQQQRRLALLPQYDGIVTLSRHMRDEYIRHGVLPEKVHCAASLHEPGDADAGLQASRPVRRGDGVRRLAFIGRMDYLKGCRVLLEALPAVRAVVGPVLLTVAGDGPDMAGCRKVAEQVSTDPNIEIDFLGWAAADVRREVLSRADVLVMPSLWPEPHGLAGLEALRQGVPVTAFAVGGIPEWLQDGVNGTLAPGDPPTAAGLASALVRCLTHPTIRATTRGLALAPERDTNADHLALLTTVFKSAAAARPRLSNTDAHPGRP